MPAVLLRAKIKLHIMRKFILFTLVLFFCFLSLGISQTLNLRFNNYFYSWKRLDEVPQQGIENKYTTHLKGYQNLAFDFNAGKWTVSSFLQTDEDVVNKIGRGFSYRFYDALIKGSNLFNVLDVKFGRQYVSAGSGRGTIDGLNLKLKLGNKKQVQITGYGGYLTPLAYDFQGYKKLQDNFLAGGQVMYYGVEDLTLGLSYAMKRRGMDPYYTIRADEVFNPKTVYIETESKAEQYAGFDFNYRLKKKHNFYGRAYYDINQKKFHKAEINANIALTNNLKLSAGYFYKEPQLSFNTIFWVFNYQKYQEVEGGLDYTTKLLGTDVNIYGRFGGVFYNEKENSLKFQFGLSNPSYGFGITKYTGYAGESEGAFAYFNREMVKSLLTLTTNLSYSRYNLGNAYPEKTDVFSGMLGLTYRPINHLSIDAQGQIMTNEIYKFDTRFLVGFNVWFFKNFKK